MWKQCSNRTLFWNYWWYITWTKHKKPAVIYWTCKMCLYSRIRVTRSFRISQSEVKRSLAWQVQILYKFNVVIHIQFTHSDEVPVVSPISKPNNFNLCELKPKPLCPNSLSSEKVRSTTKIPDGQQWQAHLTIMCPIGTSFGFEKLKL